MNYYRITEYCEEQDFCFIIDCYGCFEKLREFNSYLMEKGLTVLEVRNDTKFIDVNIGRAAQDNEQLILRANAKGKPDYIRSRVKSIYPTAHNYLSTIKSKPGDHTISRLSYALLY